MDQRIEEMIKFFSRVYLGGIPRLINNETAFLSFVCMLAGIEALAGFWKPDESGPGANGVRFQGFVSTYFPDEYRTLSGPLWEFRNGMAHGFSPRGFDITHHNSQMHLKTTHDRIPVLNAEDFFSAFFRAANAYFNELKHSGPLQENVLRRLESPKGGAFGVRRVEITDEKPA